MNTQATLTVPAKHLSIWRGAVTDIVREWASFVGRGDSMDPEATQRCLADSVALAAQLPEDPVDAEFCAEPETLWLAAQEAVRRCIDQAGADSEAEPVDVDSLRDRSAELDFWLVRVEQFEVGGSETPAQTIVSSVLSGKEA